MKTLFIDTNMGNSDGSYFIHDIEVKSMQLKPGETVIAYQDDDMWTAEVVCLMRDMV